MAEHKSQSSFPYIAIVALVAVVGIVVLVLNGFPTSSGESGAVEEDVAVEGIEEEVNEGALAGQGIAAALSTCMVCGNGIVEPGEACDDRNTVTGDGCSAILGVCRVDSGFACAGTPSVCIRPVCGNGVVETGEVCDDGNTNRMRNHVAYPSKLIVIDDICSRDCKVQDSDSGIVPWVKGTYTNVTRSTTDICVKDKYAGSVRHASSTAMYDYFFSEAYGTMGESWNDCNQYGATCADGTCVCPTGKVMCYRPSMEDWFCLTSCS